MNRTCEMEPQAHYGDVSLAEALSRLAHEIRDSRKVSTAQLEWFKSQPQDFSKRQLERFSDLDSSLKNAVNTAKDEILKECRPNEGHKFNFAIGLPECKNQ